MEEKQALPHEIARERDGVVPESQLTKRSLRMLINRLEKFQGVGLDVERLQIRTKHVGRRPAPETGLSLSGGLQKGLIV